MGSGAKNNEWKKGEVACVAVIFFPRAREAREGMEREKEQNKKKETTATQAKGEEPRTLAPSVSSHYSSCPNAWNTLIILGVTGFFLTLFTPKSTKFKTEGENPEFHFAKLSKTNSTT